MPGQEGWILHPRLQHRTVLTQHPFNAGKLKNKDQAGFPSPLSFFPCFVSLCNPAVRVLSPFLSELMQMMFPPRGSVEDSLCAQLESKTQAPGGTRAPAPLGSDELNQALKPLQAPELQVSMFSSIFNSSPPRKVCSTAVGGYKQGKAAHLLHLTRVIRGHARAHAGSSLHKHFTIFPIVLPVDDGHMSFPVCSSLLSPLLCMSWLEPRTRQHRTRLH